MTRTEAQRILEELDDVSADNLKCGRITRRTLRYAAKRSWVTLCGDETNAPGDEDLWLADTLNDLLEAGRVLEDTL